MVAAVLALFSTGLVNSLFSGGVEGNRVIWLWAGVGVGLAGRLLGEARTRKSGETVLPQAPRARAAW